MEVISTMHAIMPDPQPPADTPRGLHQICEDARRGACGACCAQPGDECVFTTAPVSVPVTNGTALRPVRGYHVARFAWAEASGLISSADFAAVVETIAADPFTTMTVIYDDQPEATMTGAQHDPGPSVLGPFETSGDAMLAVRPADGSFNGREELFGLLKATLHTAGVRLGGWDWTVLRWLAAEDVQTVAAIAGWVGRARALTGADLDGLEPYCAECGAWIGMFYGLVGWQHFRGDLVPGGQRQLFDAGHEAAPAWCQPPGRTIAPADAVTIRQALAEAERTRRDRAASWCDACQGHPAGACDQHVDDLDVADAYRALAAELAEDER
jgi:hypothetical protein